MIRRALLAALSLATPWAARAQTQATIKLATWNLNWLTARPAGDRALPPGVHPRSAADFARLRAYAAHLNADIVALQEVDGAAAARVFDPATYTLTYIRQDVVQQVALAIRHGITFRQDPDLDALDTEPPDAPHRLRHGLDATLTLPGGATLRLLAVHLKTGCHTDLLPAPPAGTTACALLTRQIPVLAAWAAARSAEGKPFAILGDFNRVLDTPEPLGAALTPLALRATAGQADPCWGGGAFIDHIFLGGPARAWLVPGSLRVMIYQGASDADKDRLSDHCPVSVRLLPVP